MKTVKTQTVAWNNENILRHESRKRITKENLNWNKTGNEKFSVSNKNFGGKPHRLQDMTYSLEDKVEEMDSSVKENVK